MKIAIVDDHRSEQDKLYQSIERWAKQKNGDVSVRTFDSGELFSRHLGSERYDVVFMDIMMDGRSGIETARMLRGVSIETLLVFITTSPEFMPQAFPCHAFDYVIKPYTNERLFYVLDEALRALNKSGEYIEVTSDRQHIKLSLGDILYGLSYSNYCEIHTKSTVLKIRISFTELSAMLAPYPSFAVVGRGAIVNFENISHISNLACMMVNGDRVPVSRRRIKETEQAFYDWQFKKMLSKG